MGWVAHKRGAMIVLAAGLAAVVLVAILEAAVTAAPVSFLHIRSNLSQTATLSSAYPDLAVSPDGNWVVVVWTEGYDDRAEFRGHVYLRAASEAGGGWGNKVRVFSGDSSAYAYDAAVAVAGDKAHVAYVVFRFDGASLTRTEVRYATCSLPNGPCVLKKIVSIDDTYLFTRVDIALDEDEDPHVVWTRQAEDRSEGDIWYNSRSAGAWGSHERVDEEGDFIDGNPAIACSDGYAHVVWQASQASGTGGYFYIRYRRRENESGIWDGVVSPGGKTFNLPIANPDVAAGAGRVFVVWDWCADLDRQIRGYCAQYNLVYWRSDWGPFQIREVGTDNEAPVNIYYSAESQDYFEDKSEYLLDLEPSISLNEDGWPAVVWHADLSEGEGCSEGCKDQDREYAIHYTYALTGTEDNGVDWITPTVLSQGQPTMLGSGVIGVGKPEPGGEQPPHVAFMQKLSTGAWEVYYDSSEQERGRYAHLYLPLTMRAD